MDMPTKAHHEADPLLNKRRENAVLGARKLWGFLVDIIDPSLLAALRNKDRVQSDMENMCDAVTELIVGLREVAMGTSSNITLRLATLHKLMTMKCDIDTDPQVYLDKFLVLKSHIDLADPKNPLSAMPEYAAIVAGNGLQTSIIGAQLLEKSVQRRDASKFAGTHYGFHKIIGAKKTNRHRGSRHATNNQEGGQQTRLRVLLETWQDRDGSLNFSG